MQEPVQFTVLADSAVVSATWNFSGAAPNALGSDPLVRFTTDEPTLVTLQATLSCGVVTVERMIRVPDCSDSCSVWIPSAFTPDGDGVNDTWGWPGECLPKDFSVKVFDRWGELVYTSTDPFKPWDGSHGGKPSPTGVYVYRVDYQLLYQERKEVTGTVTLIR
jgi:gliding motility-associated-like protein